MRLVIKDNDGITLDESFIVDNIEYTLDGEGEWQASTVGEWWSNTVNRNAGPGEDSEGPVGPVGQVDETEQASKFICGLPVDWFTGATDYGAKEMGGVSVRHVAFHAGPSSYEYWVDEQGRKVQGLDTRITILAVDPPDGQPTREKVVTLWTFARDGPDVITPPAVSPTPNGQ